MTRFIFPSTTTPAFFRQVSSGPTTTGLLCVPHWPPTIPGHAGTAGFAAIKLWKMLLKVPWLQSDIRQKLQFRSEFFNLFNHAQFSNPNLSAAQTTYGQITTTSVSPRVIQLALKYSF